MGRKNVRLSITHSSLKMWRSTKSENTQMMELVIETLEQRTSDFILIFLDGV